MTQYDFDKLLEKYLKGECAPEEILLLDEWSNKQLDEVQEDLSSTENLEIKKQIWKRIQKNTQINAAIKPRFSFYKLGIAASLLGAIVIGVYFWLGDRLPKTNKGNEDLTGIEMINSTNKEQLITLNDGSTVSLQPQSSITYPEKFGRDNRQVYLKGEGYFNVKRDTSKPFLVYAGNLVTKVLGTSFIVKSNSASKTTEIRVLSGKVSVYEASKQNEKVETILTPNQKVTYNAATKQLISGIVEEPKIIKTPKSIVYDFSFDETTLPEVLTVFKKCYALEFILANENLNKCAFTADLNGLPLFTQLDFICRLINAHYEVKGTTIYIAGDGCK